MHTILIIDDEQSILNVLSISLKSENYNVITALDGEKGIDLFQKENPDIILTDIKMPGMNGIEILKKIKEVNSETEVIIITGHGEMDIAIEALQNGASDFINKPIKDEALTIALERAKEKIEIRKKLKEYSNDLETMVSIATEELQRKSRFQSKLLQNTDDGIIATDEDGKILIYNPEAVRIFGYSYLEVKKMENIGSLIPSGLADEIISGLGKKDRKKQFKRRELTITSKNGEKIPVNFSGTILFEKTEVMGCVTFFQDVREIHRLERELVKSERLAAIGQTVAGLAHYIKNILAGLKGGSYVLEVGFSKKNLDKINEGWQMIHKNIKRISDLVLDLLSYSKEREPEYDLCDLNRVVQEVFDLMRAEAEKNKIVLEKDFDLSIGQLSIDSKIIHRAVLDIVSNAIDACLYDDNLNKKHRIYIKTYKEEKNIIIEISDNGCGMNDEVKSNIFSSFFSTKKGKGTGLGLLITKKSIEEHQGIIDFVSEQGRGTSFYIKLKNK